MPPLSRLLIALGPRSRRSARRWYAPLVEAAARAGVGSLAIDPQLTRERKPHDVADGLALSLALEAFDRIALLAADDWCGAALRAATRSPRVKALVLIQPAPRTVWPSARRLAAPVFVIAEDSRSLRALDAIERTPESCCLTLERPSGEAHSVPLVARWLIARLGAQGPAEQERQLEPLPAAV